MNFPLPTDQPTLHEILSLARELACCVTFARGTQYDKGKLDFTVEDKEKDVRLCYSVTILRKGVRIGVASLSGFDPKRNVWERHHGIRDYHLQNRRGEKPLRAWLEGMANAKYHVPCPAWASYYRISPSEPLK